MSGSIIFSVLFISGSAFQRTTSVWWSYNIMTPLKLICKWSGHSLWSSKWIRVALKHFVFLWRSDVFLWLLGLLETICSLLHRKIPPTHGEYSEGGKFRDVVGLLSWTSTLTFIISFNICSWATFWGWQNIHSIHMLSSQLLHCGQMQALLCSLFDNRRGLIMLLLLFHMPCRATHYERDSLINQIDPPTPPPLNPISLKTIWKLQLVQCVLAWAVLGVPIGLGSPFCPARETHEQSKMSSADKPTFNGFLE